MSIKKILLSILLLLCLVGGYYGYQFYQKMQPPPLPISEADRQAIHLMPLPAKLQLQETNTFLELTEVLWCRSHGCRSKSMRF